MSATFDTPLADHPLRARQVSFDSTASFEVDWQRRLPEFAMAANAVSMMMPHVEPYVVRSVRGVIDELDAPLAEQARAYAAQESSHHGQHRRFNQHLIHRYPFLRKVDHWLSRTFRFIEAKGRGNFALAYAAGAETIAYAIARWVADHRRTLLDGADGPAADLFVWHLAEEVEHKTVAFDVFTARGGSRGSFLIGMLASLSTLAFYTVLGTLVMMISSRRILSPMAWLRLTWWCLTFVFELLPTMAGALLRGHHPSSLSDPEFYRVWLLDFDLRASAGRREEAAARDSSATGPSGTSGLASRAAPQPPRPHRAPRN
ncbi:MAG: metal-dependent hydrolase [Acidimicrobiales bacterium]